MNTWYCKVEQYDHEGFLDYTQVYLVTAENVEMAIILLKREHGVEVSPTDLKNVVKTSRWSKQIS